MHKIIKIKIDNSIWDIIYIEEGSYFPDNKTISNISGAWICKEGYSWRFSYYAGKDIKSAIKIYKGKILEK